MLAASRLTSHSHGPGSVSSKSLASKTSARSGEANRPKFDRCASPQICTSMSVRGVVGEVEGHDGRRAAVVGEGRLGHPRVAQGDQLLEPVGLLGVQDRDRVAIRRAARMRRARRAGRACARPWPRRRARCGWTHGRAVQVLLDRGLGAPRRVIDGRGGLVRRGLLHDALGLVVGRHRVLAHQHACGLALEVDVRLAADVDGDPLDRAAGEAARPLARVVLGDRVADVAPDGQAFAGDHVAAGLGLDPALADLRVAVVEREDAGRHAAAGPRRPSRTRRTGSGRRRSAGPRSPRSSARTCRRSC